MGTWGRRSGDMGEEVWGHGGGGQSMINIP